MRCIGAADPPCARCAKSNRECVVRLPNRQQQRLSTRSQATADHSQRSPNALVGSRPSPAASHSSAPRLLQQTASIQPQGLPQLPHGGSQTISVVDQTILPSIFSSSPITIATSKASEGGSPPHSVESSHDRSGLDALADRVILDLIEL